MKRAVRRSLESMSNIYKILQESFQGIKVVKAFTMERHERRRFFLETKSLYQKSVRVAKIDALSDPVLEMLALVDRLDRAAGRLVPGPEADDLPGPRPRSSSSSPRSRWRSRTCSRSTRCWRAISDPIRKLANVHSKIQRAAAASDRICALMDRQPQVADKPTAVAPAPAPAVDRVRRTSASATTAATRSSGASA